MDNQTKMTIDAAKRVTHNAVAIGDARGWERPAEYVRLLACANAAKDAARAATPAPFPPPTKAADVDGWLTKTVKDRAEATSRQIAAEDLGFEFDRQIALLAAGIRADYVPRLATEFAAHVTAYKALAGAPRELNGHETPEQLNAHAALLRCAANLTATLISRAQLAAGTAEADDIGSDPVWLVLDAAPHASLDAVDTAVKRHHQSMPGTVADWDELVPLGVSLAALDAVPARRERNTNARWTRGMTTDDKGMFDRTYAEMEHAR